MRCVRKRRNCTQILLNSAFHGHGLMQAEDRPNTPALGSLHLGPRSGQNYCALLLTGGRSVVAPLLLLSQSLSPGRWWKSKRRLCLHPTLGPPPPRQQRSHRPRRSSCLRTGHVLVAIGALLLSGLSLPSVHATTFFPNLSHTHLEEGKALLNRGELTEAIAEIRFPR
jgi:hypothetical protein